MTTLTPSPRTKDPNPACVCGHPKTPPPLDRLLKCSEVLELLNLSKTTWYDGVKAGRFPAPVRLGSRGVHWRSSDIARLIERGVNQ